MVLESGKREKKVIVAGPHLECNHELRFASITDGQYVLVILNLLVEHIWLQVASVRREHILIVRKG